MTLYWVRFLVSVIITFFYDIPSRYSFPSLLFAVMVRMLF